MGNIREKVVLVTGGASGIGFSICKKFLENKALVILTDVDSSKGKRAQQELGSNAVFMEQDVSEEKRWKELIKTIKKEYGDLKVLINNAIII